MLDKLLASLVIIMTSISLSPHFTAHSTGRGEEDWGEWIDSHSYPVPALTCRQVVPLDIKKKKKNFD